MKPPRPRQVAKAGKPDEADPKVLQLAHDETVELLTAALGMGMFHNGVLFEGLDFTAGVEMQLFHGLGRVPRFVVPVKVVYEGTLTTVNEGSKHADPRNYINVRTGANCIANVLIA